jgi:hypothetical protein
MVNKLSVATAAAHSAVAALIRAAAPDYELTPKSWPTCTGRLKAATSQACLLVFAGADQVVLSSVAVGRHEGVGRERLNGGVIVDPPTKVTADQHAPAEILRRQSSQLNAPMHTKADLRLFSREGAALGFILVGGGLIIWRFKHVRGIGDGVLTGGLILLLANGINWTLNQMDRSDNPVCDWILRKLKRRV